MACTSERCNRYLTPEVSTLAHWSFLYLADQNPFEAAGLLADTVDSILETTPSGAARLYSDWAKICDVNLHPKEASLNLIRRAVVWHLYDYSHEFRETASRDCGDEIINLYNGLQELKNGGIEYSENRRSVLHFLACFGADIIGMERGIADRALNGITPCRKKKGISHLAHYVAS